MRWARFGRIEITNLKTSATGLTRWAASKKFYQTPSAFPADGVAAMTQPDPTSSTTAVAETAALGASDGVLVRIRSRLTEFTGALQRVAEQVLTDPAGAARQAGWTVDIGREIQPDDPLERVLHQIMAADARALADTSALLDLHAVERAADAIAASSRVDIYGISGSALVGAEMQLCLHRIGLAAWSWTDVHNGLASAALLRQGDVALGVSHTGQTRETIEMLAEAGSSGATTIALTSFPRSPLAEVADIVLLHAMQATTFRPDALSGRHPQLVVLDLLYIAVAQRTHDRAHAAFQATARAVAGHWAGRDES